MSNPYLDRLRIKTLPHLARNSISILLAIYIFAGCSEWPPDEKSLRKNFGENRESFEELKAILSDTKYGKLSIGFEDTITVGYIENGEVQYDIINDDEGWNILLGNAQVMEVYEGDVATFYTVSDVYGEEDTYMLVQYMNAPDVEDILKKCLLDHREIECGECATHLADDWWLTYRWFPNGVDEETMEALLSGELSEEEHTRKIEQESAKCWEEGYAAMGYESSPQSE